MTEKRVELNLGLVCNNSCKFCMNAESARERKFVPAQVIKQELRTFRKAGYDAVGFLGGEPTIYPALTEIAEFASKSGYRQIYLVTNGRKLSDVKFLRRLIDAGIKRFNISVHSHDPRIEDFLTSVKGGFGQKIRGISNLVHLREKGSIREPVFINTVVNKRNYRTLSRTIVFFNKNFGIKDFRFNFIRPEGKALENFDLLVPRYELVAGHLAEAVELSRKLGVDLSLEGVPFCFLRGIRDFGQVVGEFRDGQRRARFGNDDRREFSVEQRRRDDLRLKGRACKKCFFDRYCEGPWINYAKIHGFGKFIPVDKITLDSRDGFVL